MAAEQAPVDPAVFGAVQLIYIARPGFGAWPARSRAAPIGHLAGRGRYRRGARAAARAGAAQLRDAAPAAFAPAEGLEELCELLRARLAGELHVREHLMQAARGLLRQHGANIDQAPLVAALEGVAQRVPQPRRGRGLWRRPPGRLRRQAGARRDLDAVRPAAAPRAAASPISATEGASLFAEFDDSGDFLRVVDQPAARLCARTPRDRRASRRRVRGRRAGLDGRRSTSTRRRPRRRPRSGAARPRSRAGSSARCWPSTASTGCRSTASAIWSPAARAPARAGPPPSRSPRLKATPSIWWLVPTLDEGRRAGREYERLRTADSMPARVVRGRGAPDPRTDGRGHVPPARGRQPRRGHGRQRSGRRSATAAARSGSRAAFSARPRACARQPIRPVPHGADYLWLPCPAPRPDVVIADESVIAKATETVSFDPARIVDDSAMGGAERSRRRRCTCARLALLVRAAVTEHPGRELAFLRAQRRHRRAAERLRRPSATAARKPSPTSTAA